MPLLHRQLAALLRHAQRNRGALVVEEAAVLRLSGADSLATAAALLRKTRVGGYPVSGSGPSAEVASGLEEGLRAVVDCRPSHTAANG